MTRVVGDSEGFLACDDLALVTALRRSDSPWARRITRRRPFRVVAESNPYREDEHVDAVEEHLRSAGIEYFRTRSRGLVSKYFGQEGEVEKIWVKAPGVEPWIPLEEYTPLFRRYAREARIDRLYVAPDREEEARRLVR